MATIEKTYRLSERFPDLRYKPLGRTNLQVSECGFGTYRVDYRINSHTDSLKYAIRRGINLIDTSSNYSDGGSEILVGRAVKDMVSNGEVERDELVIVSKGGYIQGANLENARKRHSQGNPYGEVVVCAPDLWHCIHPDFLNDQLTASLNRLEMDKIDVYLLHNPEYFLVYNSDEDINDIRQEYYRRILNAFEYLEYEAAQGRILYYGISSNTFGESSAKRSFTSLEETLRLANYISENNHYAVVQAPFNLIEKDTVINRNQDEDSKTFLEVCREAQMGVLANRPLNAIRENKITRLADFEIKENRTMPEVNLLIVDLEKQEENLKLDYVAGMEMPQEEKKELSDALSLASMLKSTLDRFQSVDQFIDIKKQFFIPRANFAINEVYNRHSTDAKVVHRLNNYAIAVNILLDSIESIFARDTNRRNSKYHNRLQPYVGTQNSRMSLSQKAVLLINSLPGVSATLVGMRSKNYVDDIIGSMQVPHLSNPMDFWENEHL